TARLYWRGSLRPRTGTVSESGSGGRAAVRVLGERRAKFDHRAGTVCFERLDGKDVPVFGSAQLRLSAPHTERSEPRGLSELERDSDKPAIRSPLDGEPNAERAGNDEIEVLTRRRDSFGWTGEMDEKNRSYIPGGDPCWERTATAGTCAKCRRCEVLCNTPA